MYICIMDIKIKSKTHKSFINFEKNIIIHTCEISNLSRSETGELLRFINFKLSFDNYMRLKIFLCGNIFENDQFIRVVSDNKKIDSLNIKNEILSYLN